MKQALYQSNFETTRLSTEDAFQENERIVLVRGEINDDLAFEVIATLKYLSDKDKKSPITLMINSQGGKISSGLAIHDYAQSLPNEIHTVGIGMCASMGAFLLTCTGTSRRVYPNTEILYHQPLTTGISGSVSDVTIHSKHLQNTQSKMNRMLAEHSNLTVEQIEFMFGRDCYLTPEECVKYQLIDSII